MSGGNKNWRAQGRTGPGWFAPKYAKLGDRNRVRMGGEPGKGCGKKIYLIIGIVMLGLTIFAMMELVNIATAIAETVFPTKK